ncbi:MAG: transporter family protein [Rhizobium sp.]|nr:transporter family protein [Rhizobium sp.]
MISFENAGKAYRNRKGVTSWVFRDFNARFPEGRSIGILTPRGQGKTTLISLAAGNEPTSEGRIYRQGRVSWPFGFRSNISNRLTGKQNLRFMTDVYGRNFGDAYDFVAEFSELGRHLDAPMRQYNNEMRGRFAISSLFAMDFSFILIDDSMDGGDNAFRRRCTQYLEENADRLTFFMATGSVPLVTKYCQSAGVLNEGKMTLYDSIPEAVEEFNKVNQVFV